MGDIDPFTPAVELAAAVRRREVSPTELADLYLERIDGLDGELNAFCHRADDEVRAAAAAATDAVTAAASPDDLPPFHGVPLPIKDLNHVAGWPTTFGSRGASRAPQPASDPLVDRFVAAGFVLLGKTATPEFGTISFTESDALGVTRNPWDTGRTPGGSSGGAAAAVASGMAPIAHGNDGGGSIRIPSSCCGLVGLKPTRGLVPNAKVELEGMVTEGVLARTVADAAAGLDVVAVHDPATWFSPPPRARSFASVVAGGGPGPGLRIAAMREAPAGLVPVDPAAVAAVDAALAALAADGHTVTDELPAMPSPDELVVAFGALWNTGSAYSELEDWSRIEPLNHALRELGRRTDSIAFTEAVVATQELSRRIVTSFVEGADVLVTPTMACLPPPVGAWREGMEADPMLGMINCFPMGVFTSIFNVTGLPAISLPVHVDEATGLPVGVQLVAAPWREDLLLQLAAALEPVFGWDRRRPGVS